MEGSRCLGLRGTARGRGPRAPRRSEARGGRESRAPYSHLRRRRHSMDRPASGLTERLDPVMRACGGVWVGHGSGDAEPAWPATRRSRVGVPPDQPAYLSRRVWLSKEEEQGYYYGFANEALWPLCHIALCAAQVRLQRLGRYRIVNHKFAEAVVSRRSGGRTRHRVRAGLITSPCSPEC